MDKILICTSRRHSTGINIKPAGNLYHAPRIATAIGFPLNHLVTINFGLTACAPDAISEAFGSLRSNYFNKWVARPSKAASRLAAPPTFSWVLENEGNYVGVHAHWLVHVPDGRLADFTARLPQWVESVAGPFDPTLGVIHITDAPTPNGAARYLLKGGHHGVPGFYGAKAVPQGGVTGKRSGTSANLGKTAKVRLRAQGKYRHAYRRPFVPGQPPGAGHADA